MNIDTVISVSGALLGIGVAWGVVRTKVADSAREINGLDEKVNKLEEWKDRHAEMDLNRLRDLEKEMSEIRGVLSVSAEQYKEIIRRLTIIESKMEERRALFGKGREE